MTGTVYDDGSIASVEIHPLVKRTYTDSTGKVVEEYGLDMYNPFYSQSIFRSGHQNLYVYRRCDGVHRLL